MMSNRSADDLLDGLECLRNHIDYLFWEYGRDFAIVVKDSNDTHDLFCDRLYNQGFASLLVISADFTITEKDPTCKSAKIPDIPLYAKIKLKMTVYNLAGNDRRGKTLSASAHSRHDWLDASKANDSIATAWEPPDFVLKRLLTNMLGGMERFDRKGFYSKNSVPVVLLFDQELGDSAAYEDILAAVAYASRSLYRQFGFTLEVTDEQSLSVPGASFAAMSQLFSSLQKRPYEKDGVMTVALYNPLDGNRFYEAGRVIHIGLSDIKKQMLLVAVLDMPNQETRNWKTMLNGQLLLHEVGHLLGAIHVSDIHSIMNFNTTWISSDTFDPFNAGLVAAFRRDRSRLESVSSYLRALADAMSQSGYKLVDFPPVFFSFVNINRHDVLDGLADASDVSGTIINAVIGYSWYVARDYPKAREFFYRSLACDSEQAAVHYYLSQVTTDYLAEYHRKQAVSRGFYLAGRDNHDN
ncbi:MAG: hypothetical protein JW763_07610 [candidate division Zixibacteria bacterium]|nr:hypothetical protein [candidate division Zixibacteria bacterium]